MNLFMPMECSLMDDVPPAHRIVGGISASLLAAEASGDDSQSEPQRIHSGGTSRLGPGVGAECGSEPHGVGLEPQRPWRRGRGVAGQNVDLEPHAEVTERSFLWPVQAWREPSGWSS